MLQQLLAGEDLARVHHQIMEEIKLGGRELKRASFPHAHLTDAEVEGEGANL